MSRAEAILALTIRFYLHLCDRFFPLKPGEQGTTREYRSRSLILVFVHVSIALGLHTINSLMTVDLQSFLKGFFAIDVGVIIALLVIRFSSKPERIAGPCMCLFMVAAACVTTFLGSSPVTGLGLWWPLWVFWTFMIAGINYGLFMTGLAAVMGALFLFGPRFGTSSFFHFGLTPISYARFIVVDVVTVSILGHFVSMLFQHFMNITQGKWQASRHSHELETRYRMVSRFAQSIHDQLHPDFVRLLTLCSALHDASFLPNVPDQPAMLAQAKEEINRLAGINQKLLALTRTIQSEGAESMDLQTLLEHSRKLLPAATKIETMPVVWQVPSQEVLHRHLSSVLQLYFSTIFLVIHEEPRIEPHHLLIMAEGETLEFNLSGTCPRENQRQLTELCADGDRLLEDLAGKSICSFETHPAQFAMQIIVPRLKRASG